MVDDNLDTDYGNENYHALDNTVHIMPSSGIVSAASGGESGKGKRGGIRGLVRYAAKRWRGDVVGWLPLLCSFVAVGVVVAVVIQL